MSTELPCSRSEFAIKKAAIKSNHTSSIERILNTPKCSTKPQSLENVIFALWKLLKQNKFNFTVQNSVVKAIRIAMHTKHSPQETTLQHFSFCPCQYVFYTSICLAHQAFMFILCRAFGVCVLFSVFRVVKEKKKARHF